MVICMYQIQIYGQGVFDIKKKKVLKETKIPGAKVSDTKEAMIIAQEAYIKKMGGMLATESPGEVSVIELGFKIKNFANIGDKIWEVRFTNMNLNGYLTLRAIIWVHSKTGKVYFVCGPWDM